LLQIPFWNRPNALRHTGHGPVNHPISGNGVFLDDPAYGYGSEFPPANHTLTAIQNVAGEITTLWFEKTELSQPLQLNSAAA
jgi:hypothetical protein